MQRYRQIGDSSFRRQELEGAMQALEERQVLENGLGDGVDHLLVDIGAHGKEVRLRDGFEPARSGRDMCSQAGSATTRGRGRHPPGGVAHRSQLRRAAPGPS